MQEFLFHMSNQIGEYAEQGHGSPWWSKGQDRTWHSLPRAWVGELRSCKPPEVAKIIMIKYN